MSQFSEHIERIASLPPQAKALLYEKLKRLNGKVSSRPELPTLIIDEDHRYEPFPLSDIQKVYWTGRSGYFDLGLGGTNTTTEFEIPGMNRLFVLHFDRALRRLIARHDMLRVIILPDGHQQILEKTPKYKTKIINLNRKSEEDAEQELARIRQEIRTRKPPLDQWPLFEFIACLLKGNRVRLFMRFDALLIEGWSRAILVHELLQILEDLDVELPSYDFSYRDYVLTWEMFKDSDLYGQAQAYWLTRLPTLPRPVQLPMQANLNPSTPPHIVTQTLPILDPAFWRETKQRAAQLGITPSGLVIAAFVEVLAAWNKEGHFLLGLIGTFRPPLHPQLVDLVGNFNIVQILEVDCRQGTFVDRARRVQAQIAADLENIYFSGSELLQEYNRQQGGTSAAAIPVLFNSVLEYNHPRYQRGEANETRHNRIQNENEPQVEEVGVTLATTQVILMPTLNEDMDEALVCTWLAVEDIFPADLSQTLLDAFCRLLNLLATDDAVWQASWAETIWHLLPPAQQERQNCFNLQAETLTPQEPLLALLAAQIKSRWAETAVITAEQSYTYQALHRHMHQIASQLQQHGIGRGHIVGVALADGWQQIVAMLGIWQAGAVCHPLPFSLPSNAWQAYIQSHRIDLVLTQNRIETAVFWPDKMPRLLIDSLLARHVTTHEMSDEIVADETDIALVYTDETGECISLTYQVLRNTLLGVNQIGHVSPHDRFLAVSPLTSPTAVYERIGPFLAGGIVVIPKSQQPADWAEAIVEHQVTLWHGTSAWAARLLQVVPEDGLPSLRICFLSGDRIPASLMHQLHERKIEGVHLVGVLKAGIWSAIGKTDAFSPRLRSPLPGQNLYIFNETLAPCPDWVVGEIFIGGAQVTDQLPPEDCLIHPQTGELLYKTGQYGRLYPDNTLEWLGAENYEIKVNGYWLEIERIARTLEAHPAVSRALIQTTGQDEATVGLSAFVETTESAEVLEIFAAQQLPDHMVPKQITPVSQLPLTDTGQIDSEMLTSQERISVLDRPDMMPHSVTEKRLAGLWQEILEIEDPVSLEDNFFKLGGTSFLAVRLLNRIHQDFVQEIPLNTFFQEATIAHLATIIQKGEKKKMDRSKKMRSFHIILIGQVVSILGSGLTTFGLGVWVYQTTASVTQFALIALFAALPGFIVSPFAGALVDRWDRRWVMIISDSIAALGTMSIVLLLFTNNLEIWHIYLVAGISSIVTAFQWPAYSSIVPMLVPKEMLGQANGMLQTGQAATQILAPVMAGILISTLGLPGVLLFDLLTFLVAVGTMLYIRLPKRVAGEESEKESSSLLKDVAFGFRYLFARSGLVGLLLIFAVANLMVGVVSVLVTPLVLTFTTERMLGVLLSFSGVGMLVGGIVMGVWGGPRRRVLGMLSFMLVGSGFMMLAGLRPSAWLLAIAGFGYFFCLPIVNSSFQALIQAKVEHNVQGRIFSMVNMIAGLALPLSYVLAGPLADNVFEPLLAGEGALAGSVGQVIGTGNGRGIAFLFIVAGLLNILVALTGFMIPRIRRVDLELPDAPQEDDEEVASGPLVAPLTIDPLYETTLSLAPEAAPDPIFETTSVPVAAHYVEEENDLVETSGEQTKTFTWLLLLTAALITGLLFLTVWRLQPPRAQGAEVGPLHFSAERAYAVLEELLSDVAPHPIGTAENERVRDHLVVQLTEMGYEVEIQETFSCREEGGMVLNCGIVQNVLTRLPGDDNDSAVLISAHYDSVGAGVGASDNGVNVAIMLEIARNLKEGTPLPNSVIFLFDDGEEPGLLGAEAFLQEHPWANDVAVIINLEARGTSGPSLMFETTPNNRWLLNAYAQSVPYPLTNSAFDTVYQLLPNNTNLTSFAAANKPGVNFGFIDQVAQYHTSLDNLTNVNLDSMQHQGENSLALIRHFSQTNLTTPPSGEVVFLDILGLGVIRWPVWTQILLAVLTLAMLSGMIIRQRRAHTIPRHGLLRGISVWLLMLLLVPVIVFLVFLLLQILSSSSVPWYSTPLPFQLLIWSIALFISWLLAKKLGQRAGIWGLGLGIWLGWAILGLLLGLTLPGVSILFVIPALITTLLLWSISLSRYRQSRFIISLVFAAGSLVTAVIWWPIILLLETAIGIALNPVLALAFALFLTSLMPLYTISFPEKRQEYLIYALLGIAVLAAFSAAVLTSPYSETAPQPLNLVHLTDHDNDQAYWVTDNYADDIPSTLRTAGSFSQERKIPFPWQAQPFFMAEAPAAENGGPDFEILADEVIGDERLIRAQLHSAQKGDQLWIIVPAESGLQRIIVAGKEIDMYATGRSKGFFCFGKRCDGLEVELGFVTDANNTFFLVDAMYGLPEFGDDLLAARPQTAVPHQYGDMSLIYTKVQP